MTHHVAWGIVALLCLAAQPAAADAEPKRTGAAGAPSSPTTKVPARSRVRTLEADVAQLVRDGERKSPTLKRLMRTIDGSDLLVYVLRYVRLSVTGGGMEVMGAANGQRIVFILINPALSSVHATAMIAHELQHAIEIVTAPEVVDRPSLVRHYERIGIRTGFGPRSQSFDTAAARAIEDIVLAELLGRDKSVPGDVTDVGS
ncbi:MAG: hypothetical protein HYY76_04815 [Acidobacteria bacterium]|nr:hypothetical protein [Acidobacteriota bacterium]